MNQIPLCSSWYTDAVDDAISQDEFWAEWREAQILSASGEEFAEFMAEFGERIHQLLHPRIQSEHHRCGRRARFAEDRHTAMVVFFDIIAAQGNAQIVIGFE